MIKGVLFDMDGVLLDSEELTSEAAIRYFAEKGFEVNKEDFIPYYGKGEERYFGGVAEKYDIPFDVESEKYKVYDLFYEMAKGKMEAMPGVHEFLEKVKSMNLKTAVATSASRYKMKINLRLIGLEETDFDTLVTGEDIKNNKPDPEIFIRAASNLGLKPLECLVVEDAPGGVQAAKSAGCKCMAVMTSFTEKELSKADWIVQNLTSYPPEIFNAE
jgi:beta-phosphoglucomutase